MKVAQKIVNIRLNSIVDAIWEWSNEQESWKADLPIVNTNLSNKKNQNKRYHNKVNFAETNDPKSPMKNNEEIKSKNKHSKLDKIKMRSFQKKRKVDSKTPLNKSNLSSQRSFAKIHDRETSDERLKFNAKYKQSDDYFQNNGKQKKYLKQRIYSKDGYSTMRLNMNGKSVDQSTSIRPPTFAKISPKRNRMHEKDLRIIYTSPKSSIKIPYMSYSLVRDSSLDERREVLRKHSITNINRAIDIKNHTISAKFNLRRHTEKVFI